MQKMIFPMITEEMGKLPFYLTSIGANVRQEYVCRPDGYPFYHWLYTISGSGRLSMAGGEYIITENMGFFFYPGVPHEYGAVCDFWSTAWITFDGYGIQRVLNLLNVPQYQVFSVTDMEKMDSAFEQMYAAASDCPDNVFASSHLLYRFILDMRDFSSIGVGRQMVQDRKRLQPLLSHIENNYMRDLALEEMAALLKITPQHVCRLFRQTMNIRPFEYVARIRIQKAKEILAGHDNMPLIRVANLVGYKDASYFCAVFKEYEGTTPVEFRRMHKQA